MPGFNLISKFPGIVRHKPLLLFVFRTLAIFVAFLFLKFIHRYLIDPSNHSSISVYLRSFDIYLWMANAINYPSKWILSLLGYEMVLSGRVLSIVGSRGVEVQGPCMGFDIFSILIALIVAYPSQARLGRKTLFITGGILGIHILNIVRVSALVVNNMYNYQLPFNHHDLYNIIIYAFVFFIFYMWIKHYSKPSVAPL